MADEPTPIRRLEIDAPGAMKMQPGDRVLVVEGHEAHIVLSKKFDGSETGAWITIRCSCGATFGGKIVLTPPHAIRVVESHAIPLDGPPLDGPPLDGPPLDGPPLDGPPLGTCISCGADLDALARTGVTGHACFGPGAATNHREPS